MQSNRCCRRRPRRWIGALGALLAAGCATWPEERRWIQVETAHFRLMSGAGRDETLRIARSLELIRALLARQGVATELEPRVPLVVCVLPDADAFARFRPRSGLEGFLLSRTHRSYLVVHADETADPSAAVIHEYVHFVLRNGEAVQYPPWYDEGLAEFLSSVSVQGEQLIVGAVPASRAAWLAYGNALSLRRLVTAEAPDTWSDRALGRFRAQAWATVHYLHVAERAGFPPRRSQMQRYVALLSRGWQAEAAWQEAFGKTFEELEREFLLYLGRGELPYLGLPVAELELPRESRVRRLPGPDKEALLADLALSLGEGWQDEALHWSDRVARARPGDGRAHALRGRALEWTDPGAADAAFGLALALGGRDPEVLRLHGEALLLRAERAEADGARALAQRARDSFRSSIELDPGQVASYVGLGRSFLVAPEPDGAAEGLAALVRAQRRLPADRSTLLALAQLEAAADRPERARSLLARMPPPSHGDPARVAQGALLEGLKRRLGLPADPPAPARPLEARLDVDAPRPGEHLRGISGWVEVRGRAGLREADLHDVVLAIDASSSTLAPRSPGDPAAGDTVLRAEIEAARVLLGQLDPAVTRAAVLTFAGTPRLLARLGSPEAARTALDALPVQAEPTGTSLAGALRAALRELYERREIGVRRQRTILLLSDGEPTAPSVERASREALELAERLGEFGVPVQAFALGRAALDGPDLYRRLAHLSGGRFIPVADPADVVAELAQLRLTGLEAVSIRSAPGGGSGRAVRVLADGSFDAYVPVVQGQNVLSITARIEGQPPLSATRTLFYQRPAQPTAEDEAVARRLHRELENRTLELELLTQIRAGTGRIELDAEALEANPGGP